MTAFILVLAVVPVVLTGRLALGVWRFARLPRQAKRNYPAALWARWRWRWLTHNLGLTYEDKHRRRRPGLPFGTAVTVNGVGLGPVKLRHPRAHVRADAYGLVADVKSVPGVGRAEFDKNAEHIANAWRCYRVQVSQPRPGRLTVRGMRRDPLTEPLAPDVLPLFDGRHIVLGRDEWGELRRVSLANLSGSVVGGNPGRGRTESASSLAVQLVPSPVVETYILDGGGGTDWSGFADAAVAYCDDDLADAENLLLELHGKMMDRRRSMQADLGVRNAWRIGPSPDYPLRWLLVDEAHWYTDEAGAKGDAKRTKQVQACRSLLTQLLRRGRAPMHHTSLLAQKPTTTGGLPPDLRDLAGLRWCFGVATVETAAACLGDDIRQYASMSPTLLQGADHVGTATVLLPTGQSPYTMVKFPSIGEDLADRIASETARKRLRPPGVPSLAPGLPVASAAPPAAATVPLSV